jgi:hypothetical protein
MLILYFLPAVIVFGLAILLILDYRDRKQERSYRKNASRICRIEVLEERDFLSVSPFGNSYDDDDYVLPCNPCDYYIEDHTYSNSNTAAPQNDNNSSSSPSENEQETETSDIAMAPVYSYGFREDEFPLVFSNNSANAQILANTMSNALNSSNAVADLNATEKLTFAVEFTADNVSGWHYLLCHDSENNTGAEVFLRIRDGKLQFGYWDSWSNHLAEVSVSTGTPYKTVGTFDGNSWTLYLFSGSSGELLDSAAIEYTPANGIANLDVRNNGVKTAWFIGRHGTETDQRPFCGTIKKIEITTAQTTLSNAYLGTPFNANAVAVSNWTIVRDKTMPKATAITKVGATIADLAASIGLGATPEEFRAWLTVTGDIMIEVIEDGTTKEKQVSLADIEANQVLKAGQTFHVPNTVIMAWLGDLGNVGKKWMAWSQNKTDLERLGFRVVVFDNDTYPKTNAGAEGAKLQFKNLLKNSSDLKQLHGLYMMGHGDDYIICSDGTYSKQWSGGPQWQIEYIYVENPSYASEYPNDNILHHLRYKLGALIIQACDSNNDQAKALVSSNGIFYGKDGIYEPHLSTQKERIAWFWGYQVTDIQDGWFWDEITCKIGRLQATNSFDVVVNC